MAVSTRYLAAAIIVIALIVVAAFLLFRPTPAPVTPTPTPTPVTPTPTPTPVPPYSIKIFTGGTGGVYYPLGVKLADMLNKYSGGRIAASAATSGASVANAKALAVGDANLVFIQNDIAYYAYKGIYMFEGSKVEVIRGVAVLYPEIIQIVVRADSGIKTLKDLEGKIVAVGAPGSGTAVEAEIILRAAGLWDKITPQYLDFKQAAEALKLGQVHAAVIVAGIPTAAVRELAATTPVNLVSIPQGLLEELKKLGYLFFVPAVVPKDTYTGMTEDVQTLAVMAMLAVRADVPEDVVYMILDIMFKYLKEWREAHARAEEISLEKALNGMPIPLHPGAVKYYKDKGIAVPPELLP
ncbi:MAG: TAXI family TRAP transporter solute-binding subunit [Thermoprotei archaeon]|nr:TAXI family TRAP transporter solute-binding subunit [Thermoprotei archaeon]